MLLFKAINDVSVDTTGPETADGNQPDANPVTAPQVQRKAEVDVEQVFRTALNSMSEGEEGERKAANAFKEILLSQQLRSKKTPPKYVNLKFACLKNLMIVYEKMGRCEEAIDAGIQAVTLDGEDVTLLHRLGGVALRAGDFDLALQSFRAGLDLRPAHWPCLDAALRLTFAMARFEECLRLCSVALSKDRRYRPAFYCLHNMRTMQDSLSEMMGSDIKELLADETLRDAVFNDANFCEMMKEAAEKIRAELRRQTELSRSPPQRLVAFPRPLTELKWSALLNAVFDKYYTLLKDKSLCLSVDLKTLLATEEEEEESQAEAVEAMDVSTSGEGGTNEETPTGGEETADAKKLTQSDVARMARSVNIDETLVEKRRSSRIHSSCQQAYVVGAWRNDPLNASVNRNRSDTVSEESPVAMLNSLLLDEIREWSEEDKERGGDQTEAEAAEKMETGESSNDSLISVDEASQEEVVSLLRHSQTNSLMHHTRDLLLNLARKFDRRWPRAMLRQYSSLFESVLGLNFQHAASVPEEQRMDYVQAYLFALELQADKMQTELESVNRELLPTEEVYPRYPHLLMVHQWILREPHDSLAYKQAIFRIRWLDYIWQLLLKDQLMAEHTLEEIRTLLDEGVPELRRPNCAHDPVINSGVVESHLLGLTRCVGVVRLRALAAEKRHEEVLAAWREEEGEKDGGLTPARCELRLLVHRAFFHTEQWQEGFSHGLASVDAVCLALQDPLRLEEGALEEKALRKFARRSLHITALCWESMAADARGGCRRGDSARVVRACCLLIQDGVANSDHLFAEEVWLLLFDHLTALEEANPQLRRSTARDRAEEMDLPPSLTCLFIGHEYLASHRCCGRSRGRFLRHILHVTGRLRRRPARPGYCGDADDVEWLFMQALACLHGFSRKSKTRVVDDHHTDKLPIRDYTSIQVVYLHFRPDVIPEFDSVRSLSISADVVQVLRDISHRLGCYENQFGIDDETLDILVTRDSAFFDDFRRKWREEKEKEEEEEETKTKTKPSTECLVSKEIYYLLADFHFKSRAVEEAVEFYRKDLKFNPLRFDSWAALSLARLSLIQKGLDQQDFSLMERTTSDVNVCMHGFDCALKLNNKCSKLMVENGTLCYEIFSYSDKYYRQWQLRGSCPSESLLRACCSWRREMLAVAERRFSEAVSCGADDEHELWYYCYMRGKCGEKSGRCLLGEVMPQYRKALRLLHKVGAKYPRRVFFYGTIPAFSLETIEVFYRCHAALLKRLLRFCGRAGQCPDLDLIEAELVQLSASEFAQADRMKGGQKRGRQKAAPVAPVVTVVAAAHRRSKRRAETEESCPTSEAEPESEEAGSSARTGQEDSAVAAAGEAIDAVLADVDRHVDVRACVDDLLELTVAAVGDSPPSDDDRLVLQWERCLSHCLNAFELLTQRIPHHYKSVRQVALICLTNWRLRNTTKALEYLWTGGNLEGAKFPVFALFKDRKANNLFNGIYRNPIHDLDRCGNFSHHMRGCVDLLLRALREQCDWVGLKEVCLTLLHSIPEVKNVCVTESELSVLQRRAFGLCLQSVDELLSAPDHCRLSPYAEGCLCALHRPDSSVEHRRLAVYKLWRLQRQAARSFPAFKNDSFRCVARAFFIANPQVSSDVPVFQQIREFLQLTS